MNRNVKLISILSLGLMLGACGGNSSSQEEAIIVKTATANTYKQSKNSPLSPNRSAPQNCPSASVAPSTGWMSMPETITAAEILLQKSIHETTASGVNVLKPSIARQRQSMNVSVRFIRKTTFLPVLMRKHVRNILLPKLLSTLPSMNWKTPAL